MASREVQVPALAVHSILGRVGPERQVKGTAAGILRARLLLPVVAVGQARQEVPPGLRERLTAAMVETALSQASPERQRITQAVAVVVVQAPEGRTVLAGLVVAVAASSAATAPRAETAPTVWVVAVVVRGT
jgi:hypothetical protein